MSLNMNEGCKVARETAGKEVLSCLEGLAGVAEKVSNTVSERLSAITRSEPAQTTGCDKQPTLFYPPYFDRIRELAESISRSLDNIEDTMRRVEL